MKEKMRKDVGEEIAIDSAETENIQAEEIEEISTDRTTRSQILSPKPSKTSGVFASACLFCGKERKKIQGKEQKLTKAETKTFEANIKKYAIWKNDNLLLAKITDVDFAAKEVKYHSSCRLKYQKEAEATQVVTRDSSSSETMGYWHQTREVHAKAFESLTHYLHEKVIQSNEVLFVMDINKYY